MRVFKEQNYHVQVDDFYQTLWKKMHPYSKITFLVYLVYLTVTKSGKVSNEVTNYAHNSGYHYASALVLVQETRGWKQNADII